MTTTTRVLRQEDRLTPPQRLRVSTVVANASRLAVKLADIAPALGHDLYTEMRIGEIESHVAGIASLVRRLEGTTYVPSDKDWEWDTSAPSRVVPGTPR